MRQFTILICLFILAGCQVNPVTGDRHLQFYGTDWEQEVGSGLYAPMLQSQGGEAGQAKRKDELQFEFHILNDSTPNAWALPGGKIAINRGLLTELQSEAELAAVLGHEIVHADAAHGARAQSKGMLTQIGAIAGMVLINSKVDSSAGQQAAAIIPALGAQLITQKYGRDAERESDKYGMQYMSGAGYDPQGAIQLQETFVRLSEGRPGGRMSTLFASHPPSQERVELNIKTAGALPPGGETGKERYAQKMQYLNRVKPAYDAYDAAIKAATGKDYTTSRAELAKALRLEPREPVFHALDGDLYVEEKQPNQALRAFNRAIELDSSFFYHPLRRGQLLMEQGENRSARSDLERSLELLPTAQAHYLLGSLDRRDGNHDSARYHYEQAAQSESQAGTDAQRELVLMDIGNEPGKYVATRQAADSQGRLYCTIGNRTRIDLTGISVKATFIDDGGQSRQTSKVYSSVLGGGKQDNMRFGWNTANTAGLEQRMRCEVLQARVVD
jgi:predicted Zn-dependent protease